MQKPKIAVVGADGYVGRAWTEMLRDHYSVVTHDRRSDDRDQRERVNRRVDVAYVCVDTPPREDGSCGTRNVSKVLNWLRTSLIVIKSTVPPGFTKQAQENHESKLVFSPEFIGQGYYHSTWPFDKDPKALPWHILGETEKGGAREAADILMPICGPQARYILTDSCSAEMTKLVTNAFFATKVTFVNEMSRICEAMGIEWVKVRDQWLADPRVEPMHTMVFPGQPGFGGRCFPKDLANLIHSSVKAGHDPEFLHEVRESNERFQGETGP